MKIEIVDHQFTKQRNSTFPYYLLKTSWCFAKEGRAEVLESFGFLDFRYCHFAAITRVDINVGSSLRTEKDWFFKNAQQITQRENQPDEDELIILLLETKAEQGSRNLLPVDVVQEHIPLVQSPVDVVEETNLARVSKQTLGWDTWFLPERRVHVLPETRNETHLSVRLLATGETLDIRAHVVPLCGGNNLLIERERKCLPGVRKMKFSSLRWWLMSIEIVLPYWLLNISDSRANLLEMMLEIVFRMNR